MTSREDTSILIAAVLAGCTLAGTARRTGLSISTVQRRLKEPALLEALQDARAQSQRELIGSVNQGALPAVERLIQHVDSGDPHVSLRAIDLLLRVSSKWATVVDLQERLAVIEATLEQHPDEP